MEISEILNRAKTDSLKDVTELNMILNDSYENDIETILSTVSLSLNIDYPKDHQHSDDISIDTCVDHENICMLDDSINHEDVNEINEDTNFLGDIKSLQIRDFSGKVCDGNSDKNFLKVLVNGQEKLLRKSTLCWYFFDKHNGRLSTDRLSRFKTGTGINLEAKTNDTKVNFPVQLEKYYSVFYDEGWYLGRILETLKGKSVIKFLKSELENYVWPTKVDVQTVDDQYIFHGPVTLLGNYPFKIKYEDRVIIDAKYKLLKKKK